MTSFEFSQSHNMPPAPPMCNLSDLPHDKTSDDGGPGDAAGLRPFGVVIYFSTAAAQAHQVYCKDKQAQTQTHCTNTG